MKNLILAVPTFSQFYLPKCEDRWKKHNGFTRNFRFFDCQLIDFFPSIFRSIFLQPPPPLWYLPKKCFHLPRNVVEWVEEIIWLDLVLFSILSFIFLNQIEDKFILWYEESWAELLPCLWCIVNVLYKVRKRVLPDWNIKYLWVQLTLRHRTGLDVPRFTRNWLLLFFHLFFRGMLAASTFTVTATTSWPGIEWVWVTTTTTKGIFCALMPLRCLNSADRLMIRYQISTTFG